MNFFESQDTAKRNTGKLIFLFVLAVLSLIVVTNLMIMLVLGFSGTGMTSMAATTRFQFNLELFLGIGAVVSTVVLIGSLYKISSLSGGGARIAEMMNGRLLVAGGQNAAERRVMNIVEEMAIASGTPVPPVYILDESGINAFAAGYSPSDAIIAITQGGIDTLSRDQLQGVIAHEFSHILHGDMRINIRLIGVLHGIMVLGIIGHHLIRGRRLGRRSKDSGGVVFLGLGLVVVGFVGTLFGNWIKAAVSRQREFLADASAVQFTRNPDGISQALMQIAQHHSLSHISNPKAEEISHTLFEEARAASFGRMSATHPPIEDRIRAILPRWDGDWSVCEWDKAELQEEAVQDSAPSNQEKASAVLAGATGMILANRLLNQVGNPDGRHLQYADELVHQIPKSLSDAAREPSAARAIIYFLVLSDDEVILNTQLRLIEEDADVGVFSELESLVRSDDEVSEEQRLPLVTIALSSLRQLSGKQYQLFKANFKKLVELDKKINLLEWALQKIVFHHLDSIFEGKKTSFGKKNLKSCPESVAVLLSILSYAAQQEGISPKEAFAAGALSLQLNISLLDVADIDFEKLNGALDELAMVKPLQKPALLKACVGCISADGKLKAIEIELLRAIASVLDCPVPPLLSD